MSHLPSQRVVEELTSRGENFAFTLFHKHNLLWGDEIGEQWWMALPGIYRNGPERNTNSDRIVEYYWSKIRDHVGNPVIEDAVQRYLLAELLPVYRSKRAARVFLDSTPGRRDLGDSVNVLNERLDASRGESLSEEEFSRNVVQFLRSDEIPSNYRQASAETLQFYQRVLSELLDEPKRMLKRGDLDQAVAVARSNWTSLQNRYGRRAGFSEEKVVLDMVAYECKAAFHHCYSNLWDDLILHLGEKYGWSDATVTFHRFWHLAPHLEDGEGKFTLFHGHIFGLHPGCGWMHMTVTGQQLVGSWLADLEDISGYRRVLHGLLVSIQHYISRLSEQRIERR